MPEQTGRSPMTMNDLWELLVRRRWLVGGGTFLCWLIVWAASLLMPSVYRSETVILVEQQKVPEEYVVSNVQVDLQQRLDALKQQILSRTRLQRIIDQFHLYPEAAKKNPDEAIEAMRKDVDVRSGEAESRKGQPSTFRIGFQAPSAKLAQQVNSQLTSLFIDQNIEDQSQRSESTTEFLSTELETARQRLAEQESRIKQFKAGNLGQLPSQMDSNVRMLSGLQDRQHNLNQSLNRAQQQKLYLESLLMKYRSVNAEAESGGNTLPAIDQELGKLRQELADAQTKYTPDHPDVKRLKSLIARTEKQKDDIRRNLESGATKPPPATPHELQSATPMLQLEGQLKANQQEIEDTKRELASVNSQIGSYQGRLNEAPLREQQLADLTRDYEQSKDNYDSLLKKQMASQLSTNLTKRQQGEQFRILDPPSLPTQPVSPNRVRMSLMGLVVGLVVGLGLAIGVETLEDKLRNEEEIVRIVKVRILAGVPHLSTPEEQKRKRRQKIFEWGFAGVLFLVLVAVNLITAFREIAAMYEKFYGFNQNPFRMSPDPAFYYATARHNEALANLTYGVLMQKGFIVLTGEVGTGKTLLVRCLLDTLHRSHVAHAYVFNPLMSADDLLRTILTDFGIRDVKRTKAEMLQQFNEYLIDVYRQGGVTALVIDEAHLLDPLLLEEIRLMTNIETSKHKLLQIVLVGQPELDETLDSPELRQLKQRVSLRYGLEALSDMEVRGYIDRRMEIAGAPNSLMRIFPAPTLARILHYAHGIPRLVNSICDSALVSGYGKQMKSITPALIDEVTADLRIGMKSSAAKMTGTPLDGRMAGDDMSRKVLVKTLKRLVKMLEPDEDEGQEKKQGVAG